MMQEKARNKLLIICGLSFAGKTTLGNALVKKFGFERVEVDVTKDKLYGVGLKDDDLTHEQWVKIYAETDKQIETYLHAGKSVVDDSRNFSKSERAHAKEIAEKCGAGFLTIYVNTPEQIVRHRLIENRNNPTRHDVEDKNFEEIIQVFDPPTGDENAVAFRQTDTIDDWISKLPLT